MPIAIIRDVKTTQVACTGIAVSVTNSRAITPAASVLAVTGESRRNRTEGGPIRVRIAGPPLLSHAVSLMLDVLPGITCFPVSSKSRDMDVVIVALLSNATPPGPLVGASRALPDTPAVLLVPSGIAVEREIASSFSAIYAAAGLAVVGVVYWDDDATTLSRALQVAVQDALTVAPSCAASRGAMPERNADSAGADGWGLSQTERGVAYLAATGHSNAEIADRLHVSVNTVKTHLKEVFRKMGTRRRCEVAVRLASVAAAGHRGLTEPGAARQKKDPPKSPERVTPSVSRMRPT